jgi:DNA-binding CsgD family transcriptional regulator
MRAMEHMLFGSLVVDAATGRFVASNPRAEELLGGSVPDAVADLVERGLLSRPAYEDLVEHAGRRDPTSWTIPLTLHLGAERSDLTLLAAAVHEPAVDATAIVALLTERGREQIFVEYSLPDGAPEQMIGAYDTLFRVRAVDPRLGYFWPEPTSELGILSWLLFHPADLCRIVPRFRELVDGEAEAVVAVVRTRNPFGNWSPIHFELRRMLGDLDAPIFVTFTVPVHADFRDTIEPGLLTARELTIVTALFDNRRIPQIAARDGVSEKTLRNQLSTIYRKLRVANQGELLDRYLRPGSPA